MQEEKRDIFLFFSRYLFSQEFGLMSTSSQVTELNVPRVDTHQGKFAQGSTVLLTALAFLLNLPILVLITAVVMTWSAFT